MGSYNFDGKNQILTSKIRIKIQIKTERPLV